MCTVDIWAAAENSHPNPHTTNHLQWQKKKYINIYCSYIFFRKNVHWKNENNIVGFFRGTI